MNEQKSSHIMVDIETLSNPDKDTSPVILGIAAINFDPNTGSRGDTFQINISVDDQLYRGMKINGETLAWWINQKNPETLKNLLKDQQLLVRALNAFSDWLRQIAAKNYDNGDRTDNLRLWGRSPRFDLGILRNAYMLAQLQPAWDGKKELDVRTIEWLKPSLKVKIDNEQKERGTFYTHDPLQDCINQIEYTSAILKDIGLDFEKE